MKVDSFKLVLCLVAVVMTLSACSFGSGGGGQAPVATVAAAQQATQPPDQLSGPYFQEDFGGGLKDWSHFVVNGTKTAAGGNAVLNDGDFGTMTVGTTDGFLVFDLQSLFQWAYATYDPREYDDVKVEASVESRGSNLNSVSLICRYDPSQGWYEASVANSGLYVIYYSKAKPDKSMIYGKLANGGYNKVQTGKGTNTLGFVCQGRTLTLYINGFAVKTIDDNQYVLKNGKVGVAVWSNSDKVNPTNVGFDWFKVSQP